MQSKVTSRKVEVEMKWKGKRAGKGGAEDWLGLDQLRRTRAHIFQG